MGFLSPRFSTKEIALVSRQLATAFKAGIPILNALQLTAGQTPSPIRNSLERVALRIRGGATLSESLRSEGRLFPDLFVEVIAAGELGGRLDDLLGDLANHYEEAHKMRRAVMVSMVYPCLQLGSAWFLGTFALGMIKGIGSLSNDSRGRFSIGEYLEQYFKFQSLTVVVALIVMAVLIFFARRGALQPLVALVKNSVWPISGISRKLAMARFFRGMSLLLRAGLDIRRCIERSAAMTMNPPMEKDLLRAIPAVYRGATLSEAFSTSRYLTRVGREMISVGEQSGNLDASLQKAAEYAFDEAQAAVKAGSKIMQVLITLLVGCIVGYIVISFYGNLYSQSFYNI